MMACAPSGPRPYQRQLGPRIAARARDDISSDCATTWAQNFNIQPSTALGLAGNCSIIPVALELPSDSSEFVSSPRSDSNASYAFVDRSGSSRLRSCKIQPIRQHRCLLPYVTYTHHSPQASEANRSRLRARLNITLSHTSLIQINHSIEICSLQ
jgi:hypothetical protein